MFEMGISVYTGLKEYNDISNEEYIKRAGSLGYKLVFTSGHIAEANDEKESFNKMCDACISSNMKLMIDVSKKMFDSLKLNKAIGVLRLDYGFSDEDIINLSNSQDFGIQLNASTVSLEKLQVLISKGLNASNTSLCYNFYPKELTGHDISFVYDKTKMYHNLGFKVYGFIPSFTGRRAPLYEGLPTVESHRTLSLSLSIEELKACKLDGIIYGDSYASQNELELLKLHQCDEVLIRLKLYDNSLNSLFNSSFKIRPDYNRIILRLSKERISNIEPFNNKIRQRFDLTMDNKLFLRYSGEINIILKDQPASTRCNVIGHLDLSDIVVEELIKGKSFRFIEKEEIC